MSKGAALGEDVARAIDIAQLETPCFVTDLVALADHVVLNSPTQWRRHRAVIARAGLSAGLRVNHEHQEAENALYDPAGACSRLGTVRANVDDIAGLDGLHFHSLCQNNSDALERAV